METVEPQPNPFRALTAWIPILMSGAAIALVAGYLATGPHEPYMVVENGVAREDEGAVAHLWQLPRIAISRTKIVLPRSKRRVIPCYD